MGFASVAGRALRIAKRALPYGLVMRLCGRDDVRRSVLRDILPYGFVSRFLAARPPAWETLKVQYDATALRIAVKLRGGGVAKVVFFVTNGAMFPARTLFEVMLEDVSFDPVIVVIPDLRWPGLDVLSEMDRCKADLSETFPSDRIAMARKDEHGRWVDVLDGADIVCYPLPYDDLSAACYGPAHAVGRDFLPVCVNYGYYRSIYDRRVMGARSYAYMWKAFFECSATVDEYVRYGIVGGRNADLCGYVKMDALYRWMSRRGPSDRKRILVAPHHSVVGGANLSLSLSNFIRYADYFLALPERFPEIDFIFRPHPFLFKIMRQVWQWGNTRTDRYIAAMKAKPNVIWSDGGDYFREFAESDACIQDCGSYLVEYFYTKKPCCYMLKSPEDIEEKFAPLGKKCLENCYIAYDTDAIDSFIRDVVIGGDDPKKASREELADTVMVNYPDASRVAISHIIESIGECASQQT